MNNDIRSRNHAMTGTVLLMGLVFASVLFPLRSMAALGGDESSVQNDSAQMKATRRILAQTASAYTVNEITTPYQTVIREYVGPDGKVFGVAWRGPFLPDFQQIFGSYYNQFAQAAQSKRENRSQSQAIRARRAPLNINQSGLVVHSTGHLRSYAGQAYIPDMLPAGVSPDDIK